MKTSSLTWILALLLITGVFFSLSLQEPTNAIAEENPGSSSPMDQTSEHNLDEKNAEWLIIPGKSFGKITASTTRADLDKLYGKENVKDDKVYLAEGEYTDGTILFPDDVTKKAEIYWAEDAQYKVIHLICLSEEKTLWRTPEGLTIGSTMKDLEKLNGGPFEITGFGWDYGGNALMNNYDEPGPLQGIAVRFYEGDYEVLDRILTEKEINSVMGDQQIPTTNTVLQKMNPVVSQIYVSLD